MGNFYKDVKNLILTKVHQEIIGSVPEWQTLCEQSDGSVSVHSMNVLYLTTKDEYYLQMSPNEKNVLKWASLFHDICKLGQPKCVTKDHIHPFKGGR